MSLTGIVNTHTMAATLLMQHGTEEQKQTLAAVHGVGRATRRTVALGARRRQRHPQHLVPGTARRRRVRRQRHQGLGHQRRAGRRSWRWPPAPTKASPPSSSRRSPGRRFEGISVSKHVGKLGYRGVETVEMAYTDHRIPVANLVGEAGRGLPQILGVLEVGRINIAARAVGVARAAFDAALAYAQQRTTFGKPIAEHQAIQLKLADMATRLEASRLLTRNAAERKMAGLRCDVEAGMAKLFASETALELATEAMRIHGGMGYTTDLPVERYFRDAPLMVIGEGTNEIQRLVIARGLLARARQ